MLFSNQHHQNDHMDIADFDEFPLPKPPLISDPFASLFAADIAAMEAAAAAAASSSEYEDDGEGDKDDDE
jgi:hypothetical protein